MFHVLPIAVQMYVLICFVYVIHFSVTTVRVLATGDVQYQIVSACGDRYTIYLTWML